MSRDFEAAWQFTCTWEGGYVDNPEDPGGATNHGITMATLQHWRGPNVVVTKRDVQALGVDEAGAIARSLYWRPMDCGALPAGVGLLVFDFGFNAGPRQSVQEVQRWLGFTGADVDGVMGPQTELAIKGAHAVPLILGVSDAEVNFYRSLATFPVFGQGWLDRVRARREQCLTMAQAAPAVTA